MTARCAVLTIGVLLTATGAGAQSAGGALRAILFRGEAGATGALSENSSAALYGLLLGETTTFPTGTSAGGFTWTFNETLHVPIRRSRSFGPMFAERPFTAGKGKLNVGAAFQHTTFSSVGGRSLSDLESSVTYESGDFIYRFTSSLNVQLDRTIVSATYGLHNKVDIAAIVPIGSARVSGFASGYQLEYGNQENTVRTDSTGSSFGIGDILIRTKVALMASESFDAAAAVDIRLPTGDPEKLLGTGFTQARVLFIGGTTLGRVNPHVNVGYTFGGRGMVFGADDRWEGIVRRPRTHPPAAVRGVQLHGRRGYRGHGARDHRRRYHRAGGQELGWDGLSRQRTRWRSTGSSRGHAGDRPPAAGRRGRQDQCRRRVAAHWHGTCSP